MSSNLTRHGLREVVRTNDDNYNASLYLIGGPIVAFVVRRNQAGAPNMLLNKRLRVQKDVHKDTKTSAEHWFDCHAKACQIPV